ncbi:hypothetical protein E2C01_098896 [Portunus trituberculatus]|uniref:Uncharacterized protein n=1 Tax=Portunus trituberculatus TaxID=210409 RepID=A0A5B7K9K2_PORTR|nr:hypothetical protein [Portunus trituberculatus]
MLLSVPSRLMTPRRHQAGRRAAPLRSLSHQELQPAPCFTCGPKRCDCPPPIPEAPATRSVVIDRLQAKNCAPNILVYSISDMIKKHSQARLRKRKT